MATGKQHPHTTMPSLDDLREVVVRLHPQHETLYLAAHTLVLDTVPDLRYEVDLVDGTIGYGAGKFGYTRGMAARAPHRGWVSIFMMRGAERPDPEGVLEGSRKQLRHVKLQALQALVARRAAVVELVAAARGLHGG
jgi:hypothetical protein